MYRTLKKFFAFCEKREETVAIMRKLFMFLCAKGAFGFSMLQGLNEFISLDFKLNQERIANAFIARFRDNDNDNMGFKKFFESVKDDCLFNRSLTNLGMELFEPFAYAMMNNLDSKNIDLDGYKRIWQKPVLVGTVGSVEQLETCMNIVLNGFLVSEAGEQEKILQLSSCGTVKSILALIRMRFLSLHEQKSEYDNVFKTMFYRNEDDCTEINDKFKMIFDKAFDEYITSDKIEYCELVEICDYNMVLKLNNSQLDKILIKVLDMNDIDDQKQEFVNLLMDMIGRIKEAEEENVKIQDIAEDKKNTNVEEKSKSILLDEKEENKDIEEKEKKDVESKNEKKSLFKSLKLDSKLNNKNLDPRKPAFGDDENDRQSPAERGGF